MKKPESTPCYSLQSIFSFLREKFGDKIEKHHVRLSLSSGYYKSHYTLKRPGNLFSDNQMEVIIKDSLENKLYYDWICYNIMFEFIKTDEQIIVLDD